MTTRTALTAAGLLAALPDELRKARLALDRRWRDEGRHRGVTLARFLADGVRAHPRTEMVFEATTGRTVLSLAELEARGRSVAVALSERGLSAGDVVAIQLPNRVETAVAYYAVALLGAVLLPIVPIYGPAEVSFILRESRARCFILPSRFRRIDATRDLARMGELPDLEHIVVVGDDVPSGAIPWGDLVPRGHALPEPPQDSSTEAVILYTSGTTADPKGVIHTHESLIAELMWSPTPPPGRPGTVSLQPFPAGHTAGLSAILAPAHHGYRTLLLESFDADACVGLIAEYGVTAMAGTPFMISSLLDAAESSGGDIGSLRAGITGGGGVPPSLIERADALGWHISRCYGSTELPSLTACEPDDPVERRAYTDGRVLAGNHLRIIDEEGRELAAGQEGEIAITGPEQAVGYTDVELTVRSVLPDGWLLTGDIGVCDADGFLTITDRKKDIIIRGGENLSSREIEDVLVRHPAVREAAVVAAPDPRYGERVCAFVVLREGAGLSLEEVRSHFDAAGLARQKSPELIRIVSDLPRTAAGKVQKTQLRRQLRDAT